ncbi:RNA polymerase II-associated protein 3 [Diorhabda sublineata]|uniref:RNA polymerase II-associated protein 3 n=1 Tax=Diorhabda sublineata TaxID=1163346 RepID=UPI0024E0D8D4|nr:RNA polymerase II-associated protein 3 [Diorhabda sublineata]
MSINPILLQKSIRDNAADLQDFAKDLKSWGEEMKRKEETLKSENKAEKAIKDSKQIRKLKRNDKTKKPATKIGATDYAAWDKFDVDAELNKLEEDINDDSDLTDECNESMYDSALVEKEKGNTFVKAQKWNEAIDCYTKAIGCYSYDPIFFANRALCFLKLNKFAKCEEDCNISIKLDDTYVKAYQRRAAARIHLKKFEHAEIDLKKVLVIEPNNKEAKIELDNLEKLLKRNKPEVYDQRPVSKFTASRKKTTFKTAYQPPEKKILDDSTPLPLWTDNTEIIEVKPINKPPHLQSKQPLKRIQITETDEVTPIREQIKTTDEGPVKNYVLEKTQSNNIQSTFIHKNEIETIEEKKISLASIPSEHLERVLFKEQKSLEKGGNPEKKLTNVNIINNETQVTLKDAKNNVNDSKKLTGNNEMNFVYPKTSVQFCSAWKNFKSTEDKYRYLKFMDPKDVPKIFLESLDSVLFSNILEVMAKHFIEHNDKTFDILNCFSQVKRFSAIVLFMNGEDKNNLWKLFDHMKVNEEKEDIATLIIKYEL